jgi:hypothetical protein
LRTAPVDAQLPPEGSGDFDGLLGHLLSPFGPGTVSNPLNATAATSAVWVLQGLYQDESRTLLKRTLDFLVSLVLTERVDCPDSRWNPADEGALQDQADDSGDWAPDGEEGQPWEDQGNNKTHSFLFQCPCIREAPLGLRPIFIKATVPALLFSGFPCSSGRLSTRAARP